jgi:hypothetical protein
MESTAVVTVRLSGAEDTFSLEGPCACCGTTSEGTWVYHNEYNLKQAAAGSSGGTVLKDLKDAQGKLAVGTVEIHLPYCGRHLSQSRRLAHNVTIWMWLGIVVGVVAAVYYLINFGGELSSRADSTGVRGFYLCALPVILWAAAMTLMFLLNAGIGQLPQYRDYPYGLSGGGSGVEIKVDAEQQGQDVWYLLRMGFLSKDAAQRFLDQNPQANILLGRG